MSLQLSKCCLYETMATSCHETLNGQIDHSYPAVNYDHLLGKRVYIVKT